jgi:hypothetical protein
VALAPVLSAGSESHPRLASNACFQFHLADNADQCSNDYNGDKNCDLSRK